MKDERNTAQSVEEFGIKQANLVGYVEGIEDIWQDLSQERIDLIDNMDALDIRHSPQRAFSLGVIAMEQRVIENCLLRIQEAHQAQLELCEEVKRRKRNDG